MTLTEAGFAKREVRVPWLNNYVLRIAFLLESTDREIPHARIQAKELVRASEELTRLRKL